MKFYQTFRSVHITIWNVCLIVRKNCESFEIAAENEKLQQKKGMKSIEKNGTLEKRIPAPVTNQVVTDDKIIASTVMKI